jgi:hypothetical protein
MKTMIAENAWSDRLIEAITEDAAKTMGMK